MMNTESPEVIKAEVPQLKTLKIVGKIDLDAINAKTKPMRKSKAQLLAEQEERIRLEKEKRDVYKMARKTKQKEKVTVNKEVTKVSETVEQAKNIKPEQVADNPRKRRLLPQWLLDMFGGGRTR